MHVVTKIDTYLEKIARTIAGKPADFEVVTKEQLYLLKQGDFILSTNGIIEDGRKYVIEVGQFYTLIGGAETPECFIKHRGSLSFELEDLKAYRPAELEYTEPQFKRRQFQEPKYSSLQDYYRFMEIIQHRVMLKMIYK